MSNSQKYNFKIAVIGDGSVGKTSLIKKFTEGSFQTDYIKTIGAQFSEYDVEIDGDRVRLIFWDIAGQDDFLFLRPSFYRESKAAIIVYSLEENDLGSQSLRHVPDWYDDIKKYCRDISIVVFANKVDLINNGDLDKAKIEQIVKECDFLGYYLTSAKTGQGVYEAFNAIINTLYKASKALSSKL
ncbi:MAG: Rab family GTPase [Promethearchaeota archaeon]